MELQVYLQQRDKYSQLVDAVVVFEILEEKIVDGVEDEVVAELLQNGEQDLTCCLRFQ
jgi:hypothetical protein